MAYYFDKPFSRVAYFEWLSGELDIMAADLDREIKAVEERTGWAVSPWLREARRRRDNLRLSSDQLRQTIRRERRASRARRMRRQ